MSGDGKRKFNSCDLSPITQSQKKLYLKRNEDDTDACSVTQNNEEDCYKKLMDKFYSLTNLLVQKEIDLRQKEYQIAQKNRQIIHLEKQLKFVYSKDPAVRNFLEIASEKNLINTNLEQLKYQVDSGDCMLSSKFHDFTWLSPNYAFMIPVFLLGKFKTMSDNLKNSTTGIYREMVRTFVSDRKLLGNSSGRILQHECPIVLVLSDYLKHLRPDFTNDSMIKCLKSYAVKRASKHGKSTQTIFS